jgi:hypothetical protein
MKKLAYLGAIILGFVLLTAASSPFTDIMVKGVPWYDVRFHATLSSALSEIGNSTQKTVYILRSEAVTADLTPTANVNFVFFGPGALAVSSGKVLDLSACTLESADRTIFSGSGTIKPPKNPTKVEWFGTLASAVSMLSTNETVLSVETNQAITTSLSVPSTISFDVRANGRFTISAAQTLTLAGAFSALNKQVFFGNGYAVLSSAQALQADWWPSFAKAVEDIGANQRVLEVRTAKLISGSISVPATLSLNILIGGSLQPAVGTTTAILGPFTAGPYEIFSGLGTVTGVQALPAYSEWFHTDSGTGDNGPAIAKCLSYFRRVDGIPTTTYTIKTDVAVPSWSTIDFHMAAVNGDAAITTAMFNVSGVGTAGEAPDAGKTNIKFSNMRIDPKGAKLGIYLLSSFLIELDNVRWLNLDQTPDITGLVIRNSFMVTIRQCNFHGNYGTGTRGIHISSTYDETGYFAINNIGIYETALQRSMYNLSLNYDEGTAGGIASNTMVVQDSSFQCGTVNTPTEFFGYGVYIWAGSIANALFTNNKTEYGIAGFYVGENATINDIKISGHNFANTQTLFDFHGNGYVGLEQIRYTSGAGASIPASPANFSIVGTNNLNLAIAGHGFTLFDAGDRYATNGIWPGTGSGSLIRDAEYIVTHTGNFTILPGHEHYVVNNLGATGSVVYTLPLLSTVHEGFRIAVIPSVAGKTVSVTPSGSDIILHYTLGGSIYCAGMASPLWLTATSAGWLTAAQPIGWRDYDTNLMDLSSDATTGTGNLKSVILPANTLSRYSGVELEISGTKTGTKGKKAINFAFGSTTLNLVVAYNDVLDWFARILIDCVGPTSQRISFISSSGNQTRADYATSAVDVTTPIVMTTSAVCDNATDVVTETKWRVTWK